MRVVLPANLDGTLRSRGGAAVRSFAFVAALFFVLTPVAGEAVQSPISVCAQNATEYQGTVRLWEAPAELDESLSVFKINHGRQTLAFDVDAHEARCVEWSALPMFVATAVLRGAPWGERAQRPSEWLCNQNVVSLGHDYGIWQLDAVRDGVVWLLITDWRAHGGEFVCINTHNGSSDDPGGVVDLSLPRFSRPG